MKREPTIWKNIFVNDMLDKSLISKIFKQIFVYGYLKILYMTHAILNVLN